MITSNTTRRVVSVGWAMLDVSTWRHSPRSIPRGDDAPAIDGIGLCSTIG
jgi:hypothetical protein